MSSNVFAIQAKLKNIAKNENKTYQVILIRYFQECLLYRLSLSAYKNNFFLKGGALVYVFEKKMSRPTLDIDFLGQGIKADPIFLKQVFEEICTIQDRDDGVLFDAKSLRHSDIKKEGTYSGVRLKLLVTLGQIKQILQIDIGFGDTVTRPLLIDYPTLLEMDKPNIKAYSVEDVIAEKFQAMIDLAEMNSRMKDFYDIYQLLSTKHYDNQSLQAAIINTFHKRQTAYQANHPLFSEEFALSATRQKQWDHFLAKSKLSLNICFTGVMRYLVKILLPFYQNLQ